MQMLITQGGLAGLRAGGLGAGEGLWTSAEGPRGSCPVLAAEAEAPRTRSVTLPLHADSAEGKGPRRARPMFQSAVSAGLGEGRAEEGWEGDRMGVGQHLQHLLICITTDTLLDQENGARNNQGEGDSLGGPLRFFFLAPTLPVLRARGQPPPPSLAGPWWGNVPIFAAPSPGWAVSPSQPPTSLGPKHPSLAPFLGAYTASLPPSGNPLPGAPHTAVLTPALPSFVVLFSSSCLPPQTRRFPGQGPDIPHQPRENILPEK